MGFDSKNNFRQGYGSQNRFRSSVNRNSGNRSRFKNSNRERIDVAKFIKKPSKIEPDDVAEIKHSFEDFKFVRQLNDNLKNKKYTTPTPIQDQSIMHIMDGKDILGLANTGTGKTAAFLLPLINKVYNDRSESVLIVTPTRELAIQINNEFREFSWYMKIFSAVCVGGTPIYRQISDLKRNPEFVIGTPGRIKDLHDRGIIKFEKFQNVVIDEFDRMLDMGFIDDVKMFLDKLPSNRQSLFFSATMPPKIKNLANDFLIDPICIEIKSTRTSENIDQDIVKIHDRKEKFNRLKEILNKEEVKKALIFTETKMEVERLSQDLSANGFRADSIHGDKRQGQRQKALNQFKNNEINILVATDVASRGLDIDNVSHVINYTIPQTYDDYIHRIGRTGRGNKSGFALTFVESR